MPTGKGTRKEHTVMAQSVIEQICYGIAQVTDLDELTQISKALAEQWRLIDTRQAQERSRQFITGQEVEFYSKKRGFHVKGKIVKFFPKNIQVRATDTGQLWTVHPGLLRPA